MTRSKLPARPSLELLRKQAKKLSRDPAALERVREILPNATLPLSRRDAQLVIAREHGFAGWRDLVEEVKRRQGKGLEWALGEARRRIHDRDLDGLRALLARDPELLAVTEDGGVLGMATGSFGDSFDPSREERFTRADCAELLLDAGAVVVPSVFEGALASRAKGILELFERRGLLPRTLPFRAALGDVGDLSGADLSEVNRAFFEATRFEHAVAAGRLLARAIELDEDLGRRIDGGPGRDAFRAFFLRRADLPRTGDPWRAFVMETVAKAPDVATFADGLRRDPWLLASEHVGYQARLIEEAVLDDRGPTIEALLGLDPAILHGAPPASQAIEFAFTYAKTHLLPALLRIWPLPDDLPHAAGSGDLARVQRWFAPGGEPVLGELSRHFPANSPRTRRDLQWGAPDVQQVLDTALAWSVLNDHFEVADFLLEHGADIDTDWCSHEPASILHDLVFHGNYPAMKFLIDRGIDMTIRDYRWDATAEGWARYAARDEKMADWLRAQAAAQG